LDKDPTDMKLKLFLHRHWLTLLSALLVLALAYWTYSAYQELSLIWQAMQ
jgi:hypothetical protein